MECIATTVSLNGIFALYYEEIGQGEHRSLIFHSTLSGTATLVADLDVWVVSIWCGSNDALFLATWDGEIMSVSDGITQLAVCDLFGVIGIEGFGEKPLFLFGEEGSLFRSRGEEWQKIHVKGGMDVYAVSKQGEERYVFACSDGKLLTLDSSLTVTNLPTNVDLHGIAHIDQNNGCVVGELGALFLYNSGAWEDRSQNFGSIHDVIALRDLYYFSAQEGGLYTMDVNGEVKSIYEIPTYYLSERNERIGTFTDDAIVIIDDSRVIEQTHESILSSTAL